MAFNSSTFHLPDGDITLVSWEFVIGKLTEFITPLISIISDENQSLDSIITKLDSWIDDDEEEVQ